MILMGGMSTVKEGTAFIFKDPNRAFRKLSYFTFNL